MYDAASRRRVDEESGRCETPRRPLHWKRLLQALLTLCLGILAVGFALNPQLMGMLSEVVYLFL
jgi:hypothetical protein